MIVRKSVFDLKTFDTVSLGLEFTPSTSFGTLAEALAYFGNDEQKVIDALNKEKLSREMKEAEASDISLFRSFADEDEKELNGPADIEPANEKQVNDLVLAIAKQSFGFARGLGSEKNQAARKAAMDFIRANEPLKAYLRTMNSLPTPGAQAESAATGK